MTNLKPTLLIVILDMDEVQENKGRGRRTRKSDSPVTSCMDALKCQFDC